MKRMAAKIDKVFDSMDKPVDMIVLFNTTIKDPNFVYLTNFGEGTFEHLFLVVERGKETVICAPLDYEMMSLRKSAEMSFEVVDSKAEVIPALEKHTKGKVIGLDGAFLPYNLYTMLRDASLAKEVRDVSGAFERARTIKDKDELDKIRKASMLIKQVLDEVEAGLKEGMTEKDVANWINTRMVALGAEGPSFETIVCFGKNASAPHHAPEFTKLERNEFVLIDCGAKVDDYCSDVTRTFIFKPDNGTEKYRRMIEMLDVVREAQHIAAKAMKAGQPAEVPYEAARKYIDTVHGGKYRGAFIHGLGHQIGIDVHDVGPSATAKEKAPLREGMVMSDEPGIYVPGFGGVRIEDEVLITEDGGKFI